MTFSKRKTLKVTSKYKLTINQKYKELLDYGKPEFVIAVSSISS